MKKKKNTHGGARDGAGLYKREHANKDEVKFVMRMPKTVHTQIKDGADKNNMSMNRFILRLIDERYMFANDLEGKVDKILEVVESWTE